MAPRSPRIAALAACVCIAALSIAVGGTGTAAASTNVRPLVKDCDATNRPAGCDMEGPVVGTVRYQQNEQGDLLLLVVVRRGDPNTAYNIILAPGPNHDDSSYETTGIIGTLTTNGRGSGHTEWLVVPASLLQDQARFGPLAHTDHLDLFEVSGLTVLTAGRIDFVVPAALAAAPPAAAGA